MMSEPAISPSSRSSLVVNRAYAGPRRPSMVTSVTALAVSTSSTCPGTSVPASTSAFLVSTRATSTATLPTPITIACVACRVNRSSSASGCPEYQATNSVAEKLPGRSSPGTPSRRSTAAPVANTTAS